MRSSADGSAIWISRNALGLAPHANTLVDSLTQVELIFPDDLSPEELEKFKVSFAEYREKAGV